MYYGVLLAVGVVYLAVGWGILKWMQNPFNNFDLMAGFCCRPESGLARLQYLEGRRHRRLGIVVGYPLLMLIVAILMVVYRLHFAREELKMAAALGLGEIR